MKINYISNPKESSTEVLVIVGSSETLGNSDIISKDLLVQHDFKLDKESCIEFKSHSNFKSVIVINIGKNEDITESHILSIGGKIAANLSKEKAIQIQILLDNKEVIIPNLILGIKLRSYAFDKYITNEEDKKTSKIETISVISEKVDLIEVDALYEGVSLARNLVSEPANVLYPETYKNIIKDLEKHGIEVEVLDKTKLSKLEMNAFLSVSLGSDKEPYVVVMKYNGAKDKNSAPLAFVGKGVTFDTGGYSLKPAMYMMGMNKDMGGSAAVVGLIKTLALRKANVNVVGVVGLVENCVNGSATKPQDIIKAKNGKTIEVLNTDAEGRMVLADILFYAQEQFKPKIMINLATLTGAIIASLGWERAGLFSNNKDLIKKIEAAADNTGELVWNMPVSKEYAPYLKSSCADLQNISVKPNPGSIFAAMFLKEFVNDVPWAHLDIAGTATTSQNLSICQQGSTGWGVRLLNNLIKSHYEN